MFTAISNFTRNVQFRNEGGLLLDAMKAQEGAAVARGARSASWNAGGIPTEERLSEYRGWVSQIGIFSELVRTRAVEHKEIIDLVDEAERLGKVTRETKIIIIILPKNTPQNSI